MPELMTTGLIPSRPPVGGRLGEIEEEQTDSEFFWWGDENENSKSVLSPSCIHRRDG